MKADEPRITNRAVKAHVEVAEDPKTRPELFPNRLQGLLRRRIVIAASPQHPVHDKVGACMADDDLDGSLVGQSLLEIPLGDRLFREYVPPKVAGPMIDGLSSSNEHHTPTHPSSREIEEPWLDELWAISLNIKRREVIVIPINESQATTWVLFAGHPLIVAAQVEISNLDSTIGEERSPHELAMGISYKGYLVHHIPFGKMFAQRNW